MKLKKNNSSKILTVATTLLILSATMLLVMNTTNNIAPIANAQEAEDTSVSFSDTATSEFGRNDTKRNVIFLHPDGITQSHFSSARFLEVGPDGKPHYFSL